MLPAFEKVPGSFHVLHFPSPRLVKRSNVFLPLFIMQPHVDLPFKKLSSQVSIRMGTATVMSVCLVFDVRPLFSSSGKVKFARRICLSLLMVNAERCAFHLVILWC